MGGSNCSETRNGMNCDSKAKANTLVSGNGLLSVRILALEILELRKGNEMGLSDLPRKLAINRPLFEIQMGLRPLYHLELVHTRSLKRKMHMAFLEQETLIAPKGYRIARVWKGTVSTETEISITA